MTIDEAIEELQKAAHACPDVSVSKLEPALRLGSEALNAIQGLRILDFARFGGLLPGETKE